MGKYDEVWKETIEKLFEHFMYFYLPDLSADVDFTKGYDFLDKEFQTIAGTSEDTERRLDKLIKVYLSNGEEQWIMVHLEVQHENEGFFAERMFRYFYRIYDKYNKKIVSLVVFTGDSKNYPLKFDYNFYKTELLYKYRSVKLADYKEAPLLKDKNPFALVTLATKYSLKSKNNEELRTKFVIKLIRLMKKRGYIDTEIISMLRFIDILLYVKDDELNKLIDREIETFNKEVPGMVLARFERKAMEKGMEKGREEGKKDTAEKLLMKKVEIDIIAECTGFTIEFLKELKNELFKNEGDK